MSAELLECGVRSGECGTSGARSAEREVRNIWSAEREVRNNSGLPPSPSAFPLLHVPLGTRHSAFRVRGERGAVLIIVLWIAFGLISITLYFGQSMIMDLRATENLAAGIKAEQAIEGAVRYMGFVLTNLTEPGRAPDLTQYEREEVPLGEATFWLIGRDGAVVNRQYPAFGLIDEAAKLNLNTATAEMLAALPFMTPELAAAIVDWRDADDEASPGGAESDTYMRSNPPYQAKKAPFETLEELRLVWGMDLDLLLGLDRNRNGVIDPEEQGANRGFTTGTLGAADLGLFEYFTVFSREPNRRADGSARLDVTSASLDEIRELCQELYGESRGGPVAQRLRSNRQNLRSLVDVFLESQLEVIEFAPLADAVTVSEEPFMEGLVNINTAGRDVLAALPGVGPENAELLLAFRQANPDLLDSAAWITLALPPENARQAGPFITTRSYQLTADIAAVGRQGKGYRRVQVVFDLSEEEPRVIYRADLSHLGWALGSEVRQRVNQQMFHAHAVR